MRTYLQLVAQQSEATKAAKFKRCFTHAFNAVLPLNLGVAINNAAYDYLLQVMDGPNPYIAPELMSAAYCPELLKEMKGCAIYSVIATQEQIKAHFQQWLQFQSANPAHFNVKALLPKNLTPSVRGPVATSGVAAVPAQQSSAINNKSQTERVLDHQVRRPAGYPMLGTAGSCMQAIGRSSMLPPQPNYQPSFRDRLLAGQSGDRSAAFAQHGNNGGRTAQDGGSANRTVDPSDIDPFVDDGSLSAPNTKKVKFAPTNTNPPHRPSPVDATGKTGYALDTDHVDHGLNKHGH
jgi:hypothetical protein